MIQPEEVKDKHIFKQTSTYQTKPRINTGLHNKKKTKNPHQVLSTSTKANQNITTYSYFTKIKFAYIFTSRTL